MQLYMQTMLQHAQCLGHDAASALSHCMWTAVQALADAWGQLVNAEVLCNCRDSQGIAFASLDAAYT